MSRIYSDYNRTMIFDGRGEATVVVIEEAGPDNVITTMAGRDIMASENIQGFFVRSQAKLLCVTEGSRYHQEFIEIFLGENGFPTGLVRVDPERVPYCVFRVNLALAVALTGKSNLQGTEITETYDKGCSTVVSLIHDTFDFVPSPNCIHRMTVDVDTMDNFTHSVYVQTDIWISEEVDMLQRRIDGNTNRTEEQPQNGTVAKNQQQNATVAKDEAEEEEPQNALVVWAADRTAQIPPRAVSRLQIMLPLQGPIHIAASRLATMNDIRTHISDVMNVRSSSVEVSTRYPQHTFSEHDMGKLLNELGLVPSAVLIVRLKTEQLIRQNQNSILYNLFSVMMYPFRTILLGFWNRVQNLFYSSSDEDETDDDVTPPRQPKRRQGNVRTLFDEDDDGCDGDDDDDDDDDEDDGDDSGGKGKVPNYNGNSTQLL